MALNEFELKKCEKELEQFLNEKRPPVHIRNELDLGYSIQNQSVELFEIRPEWNNPEKTMKLPFAKATFVKTQKVWKIYWLRQDLKWHSYEPNPTVKQLKNFLEVVKQDSYACFFG